MTILKKDFDLYHDWFLKMRLVKYGRLVCKLRPVETLIPLEVGCHGHRARDSSVGQNEYFLVAAVSFIKWFKVRMVSSKTGPPSLDYMRRNHQKPYMP